MSALVLLLENLVFPFGVVGVALKFLLSPRKAVLKDVGAELPERLGRPPQNELDSLDGRAPVWIHCASSGEVNAISGLAASLQQGGAAVVVTSMTASGRARARALKSAVGAWLAPLDFWWPVGSFLKRVRPKALILAETELWPHLIARSAARGMPVALVNARLTERSFGRYRLIAPLLRPFLRRLALVAAQTDADAKRYRALGAPNVHVVGNLKHDIPEPRLGPADEILWTRLGWEAAPVFAAGSTHPIEEDAVVAAYRAARLLAPGLKLLIAPRHGERAADCGSLLERNEIPFCLWSSPRPDCDAVLIDTVGALGALYGRSAVAFVGGTLVPVGGHNLLEPALAGVPVIFGPHTKHTDDVAVLLEGSGGGFRVADSAALGATLTALLADPVAAGAAARVAALSLRGALSKTLALLAPIVPR